MSQRRHFVDILNIEQFYVLCEKSRELLNKLETGYVSERVRSRDYLVRSPWSF